MFNANGKHYSSQVKLRLAVPTGIVCRYSSYPDLLFSRLFRINASQPALTFILRAAVALLVSSLSLMSFVSLIDALRVTSRPEVVSAGAWWWQFVTDQSQTPSAPTKNCLTAS